jgi:hypothetical protein
MLSALSKFLSRIRCIRMTISTSSSRREQSYSGKPRKLVRRATKNRYKNVFGKTFKIALADGKVSSNPARLVEQRPEKKRRLRFLSDEDEAGDDGSRPRRHGGQATELHCRRPTRHHPASHKVQGAEYLRIIYGPEYLLAQNLERLRSRNVGAKRSVASREFALGIEALERFVRKEPLRLNHECVFGVLALESDPIDPRL